MIARPNSQTTSSHPRLVTAKLTGGPIVSSTPVGWSRSPSVAPSPAPASNTPKSTSPLPTNPPGQSSITTTPQPHPGKLVQPQPRIAVVQLNSSNLKDTGSSKPVWGNIKPPAVASIRADIQPNDFPTAAEVANGISVASSYRSSNFFLTRTPVSSSMRKHIKSEDVKIPAKPPSKQLKSEEVDTFRGVHLDPNAHHWDEVC